MIPIDFLSAPTHENVRILLWIWLALFGLLLWNQWNSPRAFGLPLVYAFGMSVNHLGGPFAYSFDWYSPRSGYLLQCGNSLVNTHAGMWMSTLAFLSFVVGVLLCPLLFPRSPGLPIFALSPQVSSKLPGTLLLLSITFFFVVSPIVRRIPSIGALATGGIYFSVVAVFLFCHQAYQRGDYPRFRRWLLASCGFPIFTVLLMGFISYGAASVMAIWMLVLRFYRPRWLSVAFLVIIIYFGLAVFINWMSNREYIRGAVWSSRSMDAVQAGVDRVIVVAKKFELFSPRNQLHLEFLDGRLNQGDFVGKAMAHTGYKVPFAGWSTAWVASTAWIPRIIWPNKPIYGGSGNLVTYHTGQELDEGSSFGVGQVLEFYISAGYMTVIVGFLIIGIIFGFIDQQASLYLRIGDYWNVARWLLPALGLNQPTGALGEIVSACAANGVLVYLLHHYVFAKYYQRTHESHLPTSNSVPRHPPTRGSKPPRRSSSGSSIPPEGSSFPSPRP